MIGPLINALLLATAADKSFHRWCESVGIETPHAQLVTTERSVAGRGVFALGNLKEGDVVVTIPEDVVLHEFNAAMYFPRLSKKVAKAKRKFENRSKWWNRLLRFRRKNYTFIDQDDLWQGSLTSYCLATLSAGPEHPWHGWISQWSREDPMQTAFERGLTWRDKEDVKKCANELSAMVPTLSTYKIRAAVELRLGRFEELRALFRLKPSHAEMFGVLTSRAVELGSGIEGVLPMFDMINHSPQPNLGLSFDGERFSLFALRDIDEDEELFVCYSNKNDLLSWDEDNSIWMLVQWGIPQLSVDIEVEAKELV